MPANSVVSKVDAKVELSTFGIVPAIGDRLDLGWFVDFGGTAPLTVVPSVITVEVGCKVDVEVIKSISPAVA